MEQTRSRRSRRRLAAIALVTGLVVLASGCQGTWGVRKSYRDYITSPIANGSITVQDGVHWLDGPGSGKGPFQWPVESSTCPTATCST